MFHLVWPKFAWLERQTLLVQLRDFFACLAQVVPSPIATLSKANPRHSFAAVLHVAAIQIACEPTLLVRECLQAWRAARTCPHKLAG